MIYETFREAVKNIWSNKFRTVLTMLGIIIGVTAVIVIVGLGNGMTQSIKDSFSEMGTNILSVQITGRGSRTVTVQQLYDIVDSHPEVFTGMSPTTTLDSTVKVDTTTYGYTSVKGVSETYLDMMGRTLAQGRGLTYVDITDNKKVCVVGDYIARAAYGGNAIGQTIKIGSERFTIVGVLEANVSSTTDQEGTDEDMIFVPYTTAQRISRTSASSYGVVLVSDELADEGKNLLVVGIESPRGGRLFHHQPERDAGDHDRHDQHGGGDPDRHCSHLPAGGRHRHYEHYDGVRHRAHPGDRHSQGAGCQGTLHSCPVRH